MESINFCAGAGFNGRLTSDRIEDYVGDENIFPSANAGIGVSGEWGGFSLRYQWDSLGERNPDFGGFSGSGHAASGFGGVLGGVFILF